VNDPNNKTPCLLRLYQRYLRDAETGPFIKAISERYTVGTLTRLAGSQCYSSRRAAVMALGFVGGYECNPTLGRALLDDDRGVRMIAETGIRQIWGRAGNEAQRQQLAVVIRLNSTGQFGEALQRASQLIAQAPWFAEAWNQRSIAYCGLHRWDESIRDGHQALELNPYHFGAAAGMGQCQLEQSDPVSALQSFRRALKINPDLEHVRAQVVRLQRALRQD
jgi:tetratricopeptide (TPR) repeat protein